MSNEDLQKNPNNYPKMDPFTYNFHHHHHHKPLQLAPPLTSPHDDAFDPSCEDFFSYFLHASADYDYNNILSSGLEISCLSSEVISPVFDDAAKNSRPGFGDQSVVTGEHLSTANSSTLSLSDEATARGGDSAKSEDVKEFVHKNGENSKKVNGGKKEKKEKEPRFAFLTKTEIDHLEDGYRWRKYGQKAVKNSPFPRSYYKCTTPNCNVKKRVERSSEDPCFVVTTYEGKHNHYCPITLRGYNATSVSPPSSSLPGLTSTNFFSDEVYQGVDQQQQNYQVSNHYGLLQRFD